MSHTAVYGFERRVDTVALSFTGNQSQWIDTTAHRSCYCAGIGSVPADWNVEARLPNGQAIVVGSYASIDTTGDGVPDQGGLFADISPKYITVNALCGLPIRFVSSVPQPSTALMWAIFKS